MSWLTNRRSHWLWSVVLLSVFVTAGWAGDAETTQADTKNVDTKDAEQALTVQQLAERVRESLVTIQSSGRESGEQGLGTGFIISEDGLIATNLHVIGEGRGFTVQTHDKRTLAVEAVYASDRDLDLAILRVKTDDPLKPLELGDSEEARDGAPIVAMGNPLGLRYSVVSGVVSGRRDIEGRDMVQLAMPIEPGNSGGPVVDMRGRVIGVVTMKSLVAKNLGFAVAVNMLKPLLESPNPVPWQRWLRIGRLDPNQWKSADADDWQQRGGRVLCSGTGTGFGGRSLCLWQMPTPELPFELSVRVKLNDEAGAAGLVFHSDGGDRHYGFYPSSRRMRLTRFEGPNVFTWKVLQEVDSPHYRTGEWNQLRVQVTAEGLRCFVNGHLVIESDDTGLTSGQVGLAKFRNTAAEFQAFACSKDTPGEARDEATVAELRNIITGLPALEAWRLDEQNQLREFPVTGSDLLLREAAELKRRADELERMAADVRASAVVSELAKLNAEAAEHDFDLLRAALLIANLDGEQIDVDAYVRYVEKMASQIRESLPDEADEATRLAALDRYLFQESGFHGSRFDYYHRANSYLNRVLDDRVGLPITLSVLYIELAKRLELSIEGVGLPGHFIVRHLPADGDPQLIDVFHEAKRLSRDDAARLVREFTNRSMRDSDLEASSSQSIVLRMLGNLRGLAESSSDRAALLRYLDAMLAIEPNLTAERGMRAMIRFESGRRQSAIADLDWFLEHVPDGLELDRIRQLRAYFEQRDPPRP
ncbi:MAG: tetratricopeptide repeat protein [Planctomycetales bacterium]|nr:tetratricopeptide repeat protein [Planctomycetales bacterium]